jgi:hypothetical protein
MFSLPKHHFSKDISYFSLKRDYIILALKKISNWMRSGDVVSVHLNDFLRNDALDFEFLSGDLH